MQILDLPHPKPSESKSLGDPVNCAFKSTPGELMHAQVWKLLLENGDICLAFSRLTSVLCASVLKSHHFPSISYFFTLLCFGTACVQNAIPLFHCVVNSYKAHRILLEWAGYKLVYTHPLTQSSNNHLCCKTFTPRLSHSFLCAVIVCNMLCYSCLWL